VKKLEQYDEIKKKPLNKLELKIHLKVFVKKDGSADGDDGERVVTRRRKKKHFSHIVFSKIMKAFPFTQTFIM
jgi:hypothetical protein